MNIVSLNPTGDLANTSYNLCQGINKRYFGEHQALNIVFGDSYIHYPRTLTYNIETADLVRKAIEKADVLHINDVPMEDRVFSTYMVTQDNPAPDHITILQKRIAEGMKLVLHYHLSHYDFPNYAKKMFSRYDGLDAIRIVSTPDITESIEGSTWFPSPLPVYDTHDRYYKEVWFRHHTVVASHSPTVRDIKGTKEFLEACRKTTTPSKLSEGISNELSMDNKSQCNLTFDRFTGIYGTSSLEGAALQHVVLLKISDRLRQAVKDVYGEIPFVNVTNIEDIANQLEYFKVNKAERYAIGEQSYKFVKTVHEDTVCAERFIDLLK